MDTKVGECFQYLRFFPSFLGASAFLLSALVLGSGLHLKTINQQNAVSVNFNKLFWWSELRVGLRTVSVIEDRAEAQDVLEVQQAAPARQQEVLQNKGARQKTSTVAKKKILVQKSLVANSIGKHKVDSMPTARNESEVLWVMHYFLRWRFIAAMNIQTPVSTQVAVRHTSPKETRDPPKKQAQAVISGVAEMPRDPSKDSIALKSAATLDAPPLEIKHEAPPAVKSVIKEIVKAAAEENKAKEPVLPVDTQKNEYPGEPIVESKQEPKETVVGSILEQHKKQASPAIIVKKVEYPEPVSTQAAPPPPQPAPTPTPQTKCRNDLLPEGYLCASDAFSPWEDPFGARIDVLSYEGAATADVNQAKWIIAKKEEYWGTVSLQSLASDHEPLPLISNNAAWLLSKWTKVPLQRTTGIVFGYLPSGWSVELSGRAETPFYLDETRKIASSPFGAGNHYFVFLNSAPGVQLMTLKRSNGEPGLMVALPVIEGSATFLKINSPELKTVSGRVADARRAKLRGLENIRVRVIGQNAKTSFTKADGSFQIPDVYVTRNFPIYLETEGKKGFPHRYRIDSVVTQNLSLFQFSPAQVQRWLEQTSHDISNESGLVVAALPKLVKEMEEKALYPRITPILAQASLKPQTFTLDREDWLLSHIPMKKESARFISIQIPDGANICRVEDKENKTQWSELLFSSPRVINVVGPDF